MCQVKKIMRKERETINNPDELNKLLQRNNPLVWIILGVVLILLVAFFVWACTTTLEANVPVYDAANSSDTGEVQTVVKEVRPIDFLLNN